MTKMTEDLHNALMYEEAKQRRMYRIEAKLDTILAALGNSTFIDENTWDDWRKKDKSPGDRVAKALEDAWANRKESS